MDNIHMIYDSLWNASMKKFCQNEFELDQHLNHRREDQRRGISLIGRLKQRDVVERFEGFIDTIKQIEPNQHYYERSEMHITIISIITCYDGFRLEDINQEAYIHIIQESLAEIDPIQIEFRGITASPSCILIQGFPVDDSLANLRERLRNKFRNSSLKHSIDQRYTLETAHSTMIRLHNPITDHKRFVDYLNKYRDYDFGMCTINELEFVYNDWYTSKSVVSKIDGFPLCADQGLIRF